MRNFFVRLYRFFEKHRLVLWLSLAVIITALAFGISRLNFVEDIGSFFPKNGENERVNYAYQHIGSDNRIIINIKPKSLPDSVDDVDMQLHLGEIADSLGTQLLSLDRDSLMKDILYEVDNQQIMDITQFVVNNMPYFLTEEDYVRMDSLMDYEQIENQLINDIDQIMFAPIGFMSDIITSDPLFFSGNTLKKLENFKLSDQYQEILGHIFNQDGTEAVVIVTSKFPVSETQNNARLIAQIEKAMQIVENQFNGDVELTSFGASQVSQTNSQQIKKDSIWAVALSLIFILALLFYYYRNPKSILLIICTITFGGLLALGAIVLFKNPISIIAVGVASIIVGIAINYPIHFLSHFKRTDDKEQIIKDIVNPLLIGNITTVGAFLSLLFISSDAMRDLGLCAALLLVGTILFVLVFLPHLMGHRPKNWQTAELSFRRVAEFHPEKHPWILVAVCALTIVFFMFSFKTSFETNMHKINYMTAQQRAEFEKLVAQADTTVNTIYCISEGETAEQALEAHEKAMPLIDSLLNDSVVKQASGVSVFLPSKELQQQKIARWNEFWKDRKAQFLADFADAAHEVGFTDVAFTNFSAILNRDFKPQELDYFSPISQKLASSYVMQNNDKTLIYNVLTVDKKQREVVEKSLNNIDEDVFAFTDSSVITRMVSALSDDFDYVLYICGFIVLVFLLFSFGRLEIALSAFIPLTVAWIWILGIMGMFDIKFNIVNIILATFIFGQGDDYAIFVTEGVMYEYRTGKKMLSQFKNSIILSSSIMFIGIGMLIFAKHPAMRSLAEVTMIGMFSVVLMAYIFPPFLFKWLTTSGGERRRIPVTLWNWLKTIFAFSVFFIVSIFLSLWSIFCIVFFKNNWKMKAHFHKMLSNLFQIFAKLMPQVACFVHNDSHHDFSKPAVLVANHQSHLDLLYTLMLSPKVVALTNKWVWNCPFYRWIIRYADCLPVDNGWEQNLPKLRTLVAQGYSILIFPEGTRSADCTIGRFHQGAFALAEQLKVDVVPLVLHGVGHVFPKKEFILNKGRVDVSILSSFNIENQEVDSEQRILKITREYRKQFVEAYKRICAEVETPAYFKELVKANYMYKGTEVAREYRRQMRHFQQFEKEIAALLDSGSVVIRDGGQGEFALLAALVKKDLQITAEVNGADALEVARNCAACPANLRFVECS